MKISPQCNLSYLTRFKYFKNIILDCQGRKSSTVLSQSTSEWKWANQA